MVKVKATVIKNPLKKPKIVSRNGFIVTKSTKLTPSKSGGPKRRSKKFNKKVLKEDRGVVYLSHIPYGFFEEQIEQYFSQFGHVTRVNLPRSKLGKSKSYAFIEFKHPEVAKIAAETMDNYLMMNRLLKAQYIPPEEQKPWIFDLAIEDKQNHTTRKEKHELNLRRNRTLKNRKLSVESECKLAARLLKRAKLMHKIMLEREVDYDFEDKKESLDSVFKKRKELLIKKNNMIQQSIENINLVKKRELGEDNEAPESSKSKKKIKLSTNTILSEKKDPTITAQSVNLKQTPKMKKKFPVQPSSAANKKRAAESKAVAEKILSISIINSNDAVSPKEKKNINKLSTSLPVKNTKKKYKSEKFNQTLSVNKTIPNESTVNMSIFSTDDSNRELSQKNKKSLNKLSTSLPIKKTKIKNRSENLNQTQSVKKKRASIGILPQNGRQENSEIKKRQNLGNLNHALITRATKAVHTLNQQSTPIKQQSAHNKKKMLNVNEAKSEKASPKSLKKQKKTTPLGLKVTSKKVKSPKI